MQAQRSHTAESPELSLAHTGDLGVLGVWQGITALLPRS